MYATLNQWIELKEIKSVNIFKFFWIKLKSMNFDNKDY